MTIEPEDLRDVDMFRAVDEVALRELAEHCRRIELMAGATLFEQNSPSDALYVLETGQIHILRQYEDGEHVVLATEVPWYVIGDLSMLAAQPRTGAVEAVSDCTLIALQRSAFFTLCKQHIGLALAVQEQLAQRLFRMNLRARENAIGNMAARVASLLLLMAGDRPENPLTQPLLVYRMARATATDSDVIEHLLADWAAAGLIRFDDTHLDVLDVARLENIAG